MNFLVKNEVFKAFFTYYEKLLTKNMEKVIFVLYQFCRKRKAISFKKKKKLKI
jgi:hypothetical protein